MLNIFLHHFLIYFLSYDLFQNPELPTIANSDIQPALGDPLPLSQAHWDSENCCQNHWWLCGLKGLNICSHACMAGLYLTDSYFQSMFLFLTDFFCSLVCAHVCAHWYRGVQPIEPHLNPKYWFYTLRAFTAVYKEFKCWSFLLSIRETETKKISASGMDSAISLYLKGYSLPPLSSLSNLPQ